jgi:hypothetical protein
MDDPRLADRLGAYREHCASHGTKRLRSTAGRRNASDDIGGDPGLEGLLYGRWDL